MRSPSFLQTESRSVPVRKTRCIRPIPLFIWPSPATSSTAKGRLLVTRRALAKRTWPGVWTNSFCGHPRPGEDMTDAVHRRAHDELGLRLTDISLVLPDYRYRAVDASGIVENEICPVHVAVADGPLSPDPDEVAEWAWVDPAEFADSVIGAPFAFSPWLVEQLPQLRDLGVV